jgi:hypothetical protein
VTSRKIITLSLLESLLLRFRAHAAKHRFLERIHNAPDCGTRGMIRWTREELHER